MMIARAATVLLSLSWTLPGQEAGLTARDLFLQRVTPNHEQTLQAAPSTSPHFGVRYNLLLVDRKSNTLREVDPDSNFHAGDCLAVRLMPNRTGRIYVFNLGAAGRWQILLPSPEAPRELNTTTQGMSLVVPLEGCFEIDKSLGSEVLMFVFTDRNIDHFQLSESFKESVALALGLRTHDAENPQKGTSNSLVGRELTYQKIKTPQSSQEPPHSVYVASKGAPENDQLTVVVRIRHE